MDQTSVNQNFNPLGTRLVFRLGIVSLIASAVVFVSGLVLSWVLYSTSSVNIETGKGASDYFVITDNYFLTSINENVTVEVEGDSGEEVILVLGRAADVFPFVEDFRYTLITGFQDLNQVSSTTGNLSGSVKNQQVQIQNFRQKFINSDMWISRSAGAFATLEYSPGQSNGQNLVFAAFSPPGQAFSMSISFTRTISSQIIGFFGFFCALFLIIGILLIMVYRRQKPLLVMVLAIVCLVTNVSCTTAPKVKKPVDDQIGIEYPNLTLSQVQTIVDRTIGIADTAHKEKSEKLLEQRFTGPALALRKSQQKVNLKLKKISDESVIPNQLRSVVIDNQVSWPRYFMVITEPTENLSSEKMLLYIQESPTDDYKIWAITRLFSGVVLPSFDADVIGTHPIDNKTFDLRNKPIEVLAQYADLLEKSESSKYFDNFTEDMLQEQMRQQFSKEVESEASQKQTFKVVGDSIYGFHSVDGGGLFFGRIDSKWTRDAGKNRLAVAANEEEDILLGQQAAKQKIEATYEHMVAIYIPPSGSTNKFQVFAAERYPIKVTPK
ncbi:MAG: hypothetical protein LBC43_00680 [Bifidobacteriaceae bacterium]|jgi:hypothetical protein|nr:hypothetical protein [Bifidobacteriaceae bacterium]